jgi:hypothetical protein
LGQRVPRDFLASALARLELLLGQQWLVVAKIIRTVFLDAVESVNKASLNVRGLVSPVAVEINGIRRKSKNERIKIPSNNKLTCLCRALR